MKSYVVQGVLIFLLSLLSLCQCSYYYLVDDNDKIGIYAGKGTWDGCPPDAHRCDNKCVFQVDNWTTPCRNIFPDGPSRAACVDWSHPYYCNHTDTCISVDSVCGDECFTVSPTNKYDHLAERYLCDGSALQMRCLAMVHVIRL